MTDRNATEQHITTKWWIQKHTKFYLFCSVWAACMCQGFVEANGNLFPQPPTKKKQKKKRENYASFKTKTRGEHEHRKTILKHSLFCHFA